MLEDNDLNQIKNAMLDTLEPLFTRIFKRLDRHDTNFELIEKQITGIKSDVSELKEDFSGLKTDISGLKEDVAGLKEDVADLKKLKPIIEESHQWLDTLVDNKEFQKAELDNLNHKVARIEGVLQGFATSLEPYKKAE